MLAEHMFGGWTMDFHLSIQWLQMGLKGHLRTNPINGDTEHKIMESTLHSQVEATIWAMESMIRHSICQNFGTDCKDLITLIKTILCMVNISIELKEIKTC